MDSRIEFTITDGCRRQKMALSSLIVEVFIMIANDGRTVCDLSVNPRLSTIIWKAGVTESS